MSRAIAVLAVMSAVLTLSAAARGQGWKRHTSDKHGFSMPAPAGATFEDRRWSDGWVGLQAEHSGVKLIAAVMPGKKNTAARIEAFGDQLSGVERKGWRVKRTRKGRNGWVWFNIARGAQGKQRAFAVYGIGRRGTYLMLVITDRRGARKHRAAIARWTRGVTLLKAD